MAEMINNNCWSWPYGWCDRYPMLNNILVPLLKSNEDDKVYWVKGNRETTKFSVNNVWMDWRCNNSDVPWRNVVWFSQNNPRYGYIKNHKKTVKNEQARTRESEEYKAEARKVKPQSNPVKEKSIIGQQKSTRTTIFHFNPQSFTKVQK
ncbi:hypothetical protein Tco_0272166 [Tanacetum coccineum]